MKKSLLAKSTLLAGLLVVPALPASAADLAAVTRPTVPTAVNVPKGIPASNRISPRAPQSRASVIISEGFEGRTSASWLPDSWSQQSKAGVANNWKVDDLENHMMYLQDGKYGIVCPMNSKAVDQWLELPAVDLGADMEISFRAYIDPFFSFVMGEVNDDYTYKEYVKTATLKVMASADDGATWTELLDLADQYVGVPRTTLTKLADGELKPYTVSLADYAGKTVRLAFRYVGTDGGAVGIDDVVVGPAPLAGVSYLSPMSMAYFGISKNMMALSFTAGIVPVFEPVTFMNYSDDYEAEYSWILPDEPGTKVVDMDEWTLTLEYATDNSSDDTRRNNFKTPPTLMGQNASSAASKFVSADYIQAGGSGYYLTFGAAAPENLGMAAFDWHTCGGLALYSAPGVDEDVPLFGYSGASDKYWTDQTFRYEPEAAGPDDRVRLTGILTYTFCEAPIVVNGLWLHAFGTELNADAEFKAEIITLNAKGEPDKVLATATLSASQVGKEQAGKDSYYYVLDFKFDENVVVTPDMCQAFVARVSGFHGAASYFSPYMTENGRADGMAMSWIEKEFFIEGKTRTSITPVAYCFEDEKRAGFAMMLDAYFPYLQVPGEAVNIASNQTEDMAIETYWPAEAHTFSNVPEGLNVSLTGQYNDALLHINYTGSEPLDGEFNINCPGYSRVVKVKAEAAGIDGIMDDASGLPVRYFTTDGRELPAAPSAPGIYITRQGSKAVKIVK